MEIVVSTSAYLAFNIVSMVNLPRDLGIEALIENANDHVWYHAFKDLLTDRPSEFTIHGPFLYMDLSSKDCEFDRIVENYKWTYDYVNRYNAKHVVLHPHGYLDGSQDLQGRKERCMERISKLADLASQSDVDLLVENLCYPQILFEQQEYVDLFKAIPNINSIIDVGHSLIKKWDVPKLLEDLGSRIHAYHIDDNMGEKDSHFKVGDGVWDYEEFFKAYNKFTPNTRLVLEYLNVTTQEIVDSAEWIRKIAESTK